MGTALTAEAKNPVATFRCPNSSAAKPSLNWVSARSAAEITGSLTGAAVGLDCDGGGAFDVLARLPLTADYSTTFRNFDVQKQKAQLKQLKVVGTESVTVPAGTFDAYKVEIVDTNDEADKQTVWIAKDSHKVVKITATIPSLGGALLTSELQ